MRLTLFIGPTEVAAARLRGLFKHNEKPLRKAGIAVADWNHVRLYAACAEPDAVGALRFRRGLDSPLVGKTLWAEFDEKLHADLSEEKSGHMVAAAAQLGNLLYDQAELARLHKLLSAHFDDIRIVAHLDAQVHGLLRHYSYAIAEGRTAPLTQELTLAGDWWAAALAVRDGGDPDFGLFDDVQHPPFWLDYKRLLGLWSDAFGADRVDARPLDLAQLLSDAGAQELTKVLGVKALSAKPSRLPQYEPACNLARMRQFNAVLIPYLKVHDLMCPRDLWTQMLSSLRIPGAPIDPGSLHALTQRFAGDTADLVAQYPALAPALTPPPPAAPWEEADPQLGFRATQYLAAYAYGIQKHGQPLADKRAEQARIKATADKFTAMLAQDNPRLLDRVKVNHQMIMSSQFRPHNAIGTVNEETSDAPYTRVPLRDLPPGNSGRVIVGCMKNEAPYIVEWIAYHRAIGVDNFLIYTNGCDDSTSALLNRLQEMGVVEHRSNEDWKGNSPQQHALNQALKEPVIQNAEWVIHIDVDEYMNVRTGNGTMDDLLAALPEGTTNIAMTWRLFGHSDVTQLNDDLVISQFDKCAPKFCPKPHTVWGYKTMTRNIGAYAKLSCHRPNKLRETFEDRVKWVNGSGRDMTGDAAHNGWRSSKSNVGYDLLQLNHYALRSAESFLIKRQRGRALHVDRSIGINYWIRMDWNDHRDVTIQRNVPRTQAEVDRLMADDTVRKLHQDGLAWHRAKAAELHGMDEFSDLYKQALATNLDATERVAYALALDMES